MKTLQTAILVPVLLLNAAAGFPVARGDKYASWDDVNVVAHGLLQLGQGLKEHVVKTKAQMRDVNGQLKALNATIISLETKRHEQDEALKASREEKERTDGEMMKHTKDIRSRVNALEQKVDEVLKMTTEVSFKGDNSTMFFIQVSKAESGLNRKTAGVTINTPSPAESCITFLPTCVPRESWQRRTDASTSWLTRSGSNKTNWTSRVYTCGHCRTR